MSESQLSTLKTIIAETTEMLLEALESLCERAEPLRLRVSWTETKVQGFDDTLHATIESISASDENVEVTQMFDSVIYSSTACGSEVNRRMGRAWSAINSMEASCSVDTCARHKRTEFRGVFRVLVLPVFIILRDLDVDQRDKNGN